jgi:hypothetical protein
MASRKPVDCDGCKATLSRGAYLKAHRKKCWFFRLSAIQQQALRAVEDPTELSEPAALPDASALPPEASARAVENQPETALPVMENLPEASARPAENEPETALPLMENLPEASALPPEASARPVENQPETALPMENLPEASALPPEASEPRKVPACPRLVSANQGSIEKTDCTPVILNGFQNYLLNFKSEWSNPT